MDMRPISANDLRLVLAREAQPEFLHEFLKVSGVLYFDRAASFNIGFTELVETCVVSRSYLNHTWIQIEDLSHEHWWLFSRWKCLEELIISINQESIWSPAREIINRSRNRRKHDCI
jgi:hypothetical protein